MEQSSMLFQKDGKNYLQLDCENAKELSMKLGEKTYPFTKDGKKWILDSNLRKYLKDSELLFLC